jgi:hypothetical protein
VVSLSPSDRSLSQVCAGNPLVAFYDTHGRKIQVIFFYFVPDTTQDFLPMRKIANVTGGKLIECVCCYTYSVTALRLILFTREGITNQLFRNLFMCLTNYMKNK